MAPKVGAEGQSAMKRPQATPQNRRKTGVLRGGLSPDIGKATQFQEGNRANPGGRPKKKPITEIYERMLEDGKTSQEIAAAMLRAIKSRGRGSQAIAALKEMADRVEGRAQGTENVHMTGLENLAEEIAEGRKRVHESRLNDRRGPERVTGRAILATDTSPSG
jgi:hypothetical protein